MRLPVLRWTEGSQIEMPEGHVPSYVDMGMGRTIDEGRLYWILDALLAEHPEAERLRKVPGLSLARAEDTGAARDYAGMLVVFLAKEPVGMFDPRLLDA
jgi:hypothetical protein